MDPAPSTFQISKFRQLSSRLLFNVPIYQPNNVVIDFIQQYFPLLTKKPAPGGWTIHAPLPAPDFQYTIHSLVFNRHPYLDVVFREGRFDVFCSHLRGHAVPGIETFQLVLMFDDEAAAGAAFQKLSSMFDSVSNRKKMGEPGRMKVAFYAGIHPPYQYDNAKITLTEDELAPGKYKLYFQIDNDFAEEDNGADHCGLVQS